MLEQANGWRQITLKIDYRVIKTTLGDRGIRQIHDFLNLVEQGAKCLFITIVTGNVSDLLR